MVTAIDLSIPINNTSAAEKGVPGSEKFPLIELTKTKRTVTLVKSYLVDNGFYVSDTSSMVEGVEMIFPRKSGHNEELVLA